MLDVRAGGLGDPQAVEREQGDQRMFCPRAEPGGNQQGAELVAVQRDGVGLVVHPRPPDMSGWRVLQELHLDRVLVEPGDSAQPAGDRGAGPSPGLQVAGEAFDVGPADGEQRQGAGAAPGGELAQVEGVGPAGQAAVSGQVSGEGEPFGIGEGGLDRGERGGWSGSDHRGTSGPGWNRKTGPVPVPAVKRKPNVNRLIRSRYAQTSERWSAVGPVRNAPERRIRASGELAGLLRLSAQIIRSGAAPDPAACSRR